jgi:hypothetical protein
MGSIQMFLTIGGLVLLSFLMLMFFSSSEVQYDTKKSNEAAITAIGVAQSLIDEIARKAFDEKTVLVTINKADSLTLGTNFGTDTGETNRLLFDDIDDYHNYTSADTLGGLGVFNYRIRIRYAQKFNPEMLSLARTFTKRADIDVTNSFMQDTLKLTYVYTY